MCGINPIEGVDGQCRKNKTNPEGINQIYKLPAITTAERVSTPLFFQFLWTEMMCLEDITSSATSKAVSCNRTSK